MKRRRRRDRNVLPPEGRHDWLRVMLETHPESPTPVEMRRLGIVQNEWQD